MQKIKFSTTINAPKEKVWEILWNLDAYRKWTTAFAEKEAKYCLLTRVEMAW